MQDINHYWSGDLLISATGDLSVISESVANQQKLIRRLMTNPADVTADLPAEYPWHGNYGAGVGKYVGEPGSKNKSLEALIKSQLLLEPFVDKSVDPQITLTQSNDFLTITILYGEVGSNQLQFLSFDVSK